MTSFMTNEYICNMTQSPKDDRDLVFSSDTSESDTWFPETLDYTNDLQPIRNQGSQGTCYAQSAACMKEWQEKKRLWF